MYARVTYKLSTFPLSLRDMRLSPTTRLTYLQTIAPAVILDVIKTIYLVDFTLGSWKFL